MSFKYLPHLTQELQKHYKNSRINLQKKVKKNKYLSSFMSQKIIPTLRCHFI